MKNILVSIAIATMMLFLFPSTSFANSISCPNRYLTLINPVRDRSLWADKSLNPIIQQYEDVKKYSFPVTWLLQYDTFSDTDLVNEIKSFDFSQEKGVFLEVSKGLAANAGVMYPEGVRWSDPGAVFLSAYSQSERRSLIDQIFKKYKEVFGVYPKSVGAWWIDSYSLDYMVSKYQIKASLIVADQKVTDSYGVWGQWWGFPYKPSKANILIPASNINNSENIVVLQWAQRDPILAYGGEGQYSRYSLQANDYVVVNKDINYFKGLVSQYLDCKNPLGQITVGMETGMESLREPVEYQRQLEYLSSISGLKAVTMGNFAQKYSQEYKLNPNKISFGDGEAVWIMTPGYRQNDKLGDNITYNQRLAFKDYFLKDNSPFLDRRLPIRDLGNSVSSIPWLIVVVMALVAVSFWKKKVAIFMSAFLFSLASFGLIFRSGVLFGWLVSYGPFFKNIILLQTTIALIVFTLFWILSFRLKFYIQNTSLFLWLLPMSFGLDTIFRILRISNLNGRYFLGILIERTRLIGFTILGSRLEYVNSNMPIGIAQSFLKIPFDKLTTSLPLYLIFYPLVHIILTCLIYLLVIKIDYKKRNAFILILIVLFILQIIWVFNSDPTQVLGLNS